MNYELSPANKIQMIKAGKLINKEQISNDYGLAPEVIDAAVRDGDLSSPETYHGVEYYLTDEIEFLADNMNEI